MNQKLKGDWTFLIILDACRFDMFKKVVGKRGLHGILTNVWSAAWGTPEWYRINWGDTYPDICFLSSHPWPFHERTKHVHKNFGESHQLWTTPKMVDINQSLKLARENIKQSQLNRFLIHLLPPHLPYIGKKGRRLFHELELPLCEVGVYPTIMKYGQNQGWQRLRACYEENLNVALEALQRNKDMFTDKTIITSDHGELIGEMGYYGHHPNYLIDIHNCPELHEVPWFHWSM